MIFSILQPVIALVVTKYFAIIVGLDFENTYDPTQISTAKNSHIIAKIAKLSAFAFPEESKPGHCSPPKLAQVPWKTNVFWLNIDQH